MAITFDPTNPDLGHGSDDAPVEQNKAYLALSPDERAKGFVRPVRRTYVHWFYDDGREVPLVVTSLVGLRGCGGATKVSVTIAETYARDPKFYGSTYCVVCKMHRPVAEFYWDGTAERVGS